MTTIRRIESRSAEATEAAGEGLASSVRGGDIVLLEGDLAAGKTTFVRGLLGGLGGSPGDVSSPSFVVLQTYDCHGKGITALHHVDLYRLDEKIADLREIGIEEVLSDPSTVVAVEWPKATIARWFPADARVWRVVMTTEDDDSRRIEISEPGF